LEKPKCNQKRLKAEKDKDGYLIYQIMTEKQKTIKLEGAHLTIN
jgi:hypothetical protein